MPMPEMEEVKDLALKYDKKTLGRMAQMGQVSPTLAVMAGMMRDRIVQSEMTMPEQTVAEEVLPQPQMGLAAAQQMQGQPQPQGQGIDSIPVPDQMFEPQGMAGGGIVAFQGGGLTFEIMQRMTPQEKAEYRRTGKLPAHLQGLMEPSSEANKFARQGTGVPRSSAGLGSFIAPPEQAAPRPNPNALPSTAQTAAQSAAVAQPETDEQRFLKNWEMQQRILGEDPTRERLKALFEKQEREAEEGSRKDQAMRLIEAGLGIAGGTSPYFAANLAGATPALKGYGEDLRARRKEATERAKGMAELEGMTRKEKAEVLGRTMAESREEKKTKEERDFRERLVRLQESLKPEDYRNRILNILTDPRSTEAQKSAAREMLSTGTSGGRLTASQTANIRAKAINNAKDKLMMDPRYLKAKTPQDKEAVQKIIEREEFERLLPDQNESDKDPLGLFG